MAYTLRNPIYVSIPAGKYTITDDLNNVVYVGRVDNIPGENLTYVQVDLAPIFRQLVKPINYANYFDSRYNSLIDSDTQTRIEKLLKLNYGNTTIEYTVIWDYEYEYDLNDEEYFYVASYGVQDYVYPNQYLPLNVFNNDREINYIEYNALINDDFISDYGDSDSDGSDIDGDGSYEWLYEYEVEPSHNFFVNSLVPKRVGIENISYVIDDFEVISSYDYHYCIPNNTATLYWINLRGGLSWCHFDCKNVTTNNITRNQIQHDAPLNNKTAFGIDNYNVQFYKSYTLNTNYLSDEQSEKIQSLFKSPKVWMQIYSEDETTNIFSVVVTDTKSEEKNFKNDKLFNYTVNVRESKTENIYA